jgi:hypothetical protein
MLHYKIILFKQFLAKIRFYIDSVIDPYRFVNYRYRYQYVDWFGRRYLISNNIIPVLEGDFELIRKKEHLKKIKKVTAIKFEDTDQFRARLFELFGHEVSIGYINGKRYLAPFPWHENIVEQLVQEVDINCIIIKFYNGYFCILSEKEFTDRYEQWSTYDNTFIEIETKHKSRKDDFAD